MNKRKYQKQYSEELEEEWKKEEEERKKAHKKFVKEFILSYLKSGCMTLSEFNKQTQMYPLNDMSVVELRQHLDKNGYKMVEIKDYMFVKK